MTLSDTQIREHYLSLEHVYETLGTVGEYPTIGLNDFVGWYIKRNHDDIEALNDGYPRRGRVAQLDRDYEEIATRVERTLYAVTTYKTPAAFQGLEFCRYNRVEETTEWQSEPPTPGYADLRAVPVWGDIDLADDLKAERGDLAPETQRRIEEILAAYIDEYASLYGSREAVYALDSVGGAYIFGAPEATLPIAEHFEDDSDALERVFDAFLDRSNEWLRAAEQRVNDRIDGAGEIIQPDWVNNKNRQYKPPLSIHTEHDAVVTPLRTERITYDYTPFKRVDASTIHRAKNWADEFTQIEQTGCIDSLVARLWPNLYDDHEDWRTALDAWVDAERERERERQQQRAQALRRREERRDEFDFTVSTMPITPVKQEVYEAVDAIDITEIASKFASDAYDTDPNQPRPQFDPCWRHSESGQSCFVDPQANTFGDSKVNDGGGPAKLMALATGIISDATEDLDGDTYWDAVAELRTAGYEIPVWIPDAKSSEGEDEMPFWAVKKAAVAFGICSSNSFVDREGEDGSYEGFPDSETYDETLAAIADAGLTHGREPVDQDESSDQSTDEEAPAELETMHLREKNRLLQTKVEDLEAELEQKDARIAELEAKNERLQAELNAMSDEADAGSHH